MDEDIFNEYKKLYPKYFDGEYKYASSNNWLIVLEKLQDTITNENRENILDPKYAEYLADKLKVVLIVSKFYANETINEETRIDQFEIIKFKVGEIIVKKTGYRLHFYNSIEPAYYEDMLYDEYTGLYKTWYDNGLISSSGYYKNGKKEGIWTYGTMHIKNGNQELRKEEYENDNIVTKSTTNYLLMNLSGHQLINLNNYQLVKWIPQKESITNNTTVMNLFNTVTNILNNYISPYFPEYLKNYWIKK